MGSSYPCFWGREGEKKIRRRDYPTPTPTPTPIEPILKTGGCVTVKGTVIGTSFNTWVHQADSNEV